MVAIAHSMTCFLLLSNQPSIQEQNHTKLSTSGVVDEMMHYYNTTSKLHGFVVNGLTHLVVVVVVLNLAKAQYYFHSRPLQMAVRSEPLS